MQYRDYFSYPHHCYMIIIRCLQMVLLVNLIIVQCKGAASEFKCAFSADQSHKKKRAAGSKECPHLVILKNLKYTLK